MARFRAIGETWILERDHPVCRVRRGEGRTWVQIGSTSLRFFAPRQGAGRGQRMVYRPFSVEDDTRARLVAAAPALHDALVAVLAELAALPEPARPPLASLGRAIAALEAVSGTPLEPSPALEPPWHVHCSTCGRRCSGFDPALGLVVRAFVQCPECIGYPRRVCDQCGWLAFATWPGDRCGSLPYGACDGTLRPEARP
jgi:hypothetical protein